LSQCRRARWRKNRARPGAGDRRPCIGAGLPGCTCLPTWSIA
jgi:hypothetical protein